MAMRSFFKAWTDLSGSQQTTIGVTVLAVIITIGIYAASGGGHLFYVSLALTTTLTLATERVSRFEFENKVLAEVTRIRNDGKNIQYIGDGAVAVEKAVALMQGARHIRNTVYRHQESPNAYVLWGKNPKENTTYLEQFLSRAQGTIGAGCYWEDIAFFGHEDECKNFAKRLTDPRTRKRYNAYVLGEVCCPPQMFLVKYDLSKPSTILIGWNLPSVYAAMVWMSSDPDVVRYYEEYLNALVAAPSTKPVFSPPLELAARRDIPDA